MTTKEKSARSDDGRAEDRLEESVAGQEGWSEERLDHRGESRNGDPVGLGRGLNMARTGTGVARGMIRGRLGVRKTGEPVVRTGISLWTIQVIRFGRSRGAGGEMDVKMEMGTDEHSRRGQECQTEEDGGQLFQGAPSQELHSLPEGRGICSRPQFNRRRGRRKNTGSGRITSGKGSHSRRWALTSDPPGWSTRFVWPGRYRRATERRIGCR